MAIIVVPISAESVFDSLTQKIEEPKVIQKIEEKINHWDIYEKMIEISINNPLNWY